MECKYITIPRFPRNKKREKSGDRKDNPSITLVNTPVT